VSAVMSFLDCETTKKKRAGFLPARSVLKDSVWN
jgi:hypothetical protein